jgi:ComF family protein
VLVAHPSTIGSILRRVLDLAFPRDCAACREELEESFPFCGACGIPIPPPPYEIDGVPVIAAGTYAPPLALGIARMKFQGRPDLVGPLSTLLDPHLTDLSLGPRDACVPVPLHPLRLAERGYNQAALLARELARKTGAAFSPRTLERAKVTEQQARLTRAERLSNVERSIRVRRAWTRGRVVLVDDVLTTGATALACLDALRRADSEVIAVVALARAAG